jgi:kynurenine formamidase
LNVIDLTGPLEPGIWRYDDVFPEFSSEPATTVEEHGFEVRRVTLGTHMGTHTDALGHLVAGGPMIDAMALESYVGWATVIRLDPSDPLRTIGREALEAAGTRPRDGDVVLIGTGWGRRWNEPAYVTSHPFLTIEGARWLLDHRPRCIAMDTPGLMDPRIDLTPGRSAGVPIVDRELLEAGVPYIAGLVNVEAISSTRPLFIAVPLKLAGLDGAPVRAIAVEGLSMS